ncbi:helix-turn-helix transcriptional regulator [Modicisalibacter luteus]|uniref:Helix-turn-helix transcriptional regulator n=1 Tax=Modicisalibacter luteus TaxID=453962 RepID=A0ABV7M5P6_9GAMM|nr:helix-turn-helix transcriptional regulator [Halomonas lutea]GHA87964.1 transcriptional regulator [Halomonas lutea]
MKMKQRSPAEREALLLELLDQMLRDEISAGSLLRKLRREVLGMSQTQFASLVSVSRRTLSDIETDKGSQSLALLNRVFRPFGLKVGLLPRHSQLMQQLMEKQMKA